MSEPGLHVFFGYACNLKCGYCLQDRHSDTAVRRKGNGKAFVERVTPTLKKLKLPALHLWGGEPLLYWNEIKDVVTGLRENGFEFGLTRMSTNGTLLTPGMAAEINELGITTVISPHLTQQAPNWDGVAKLRNSSMHFLFSGQETEAWGWLRTVRDLEQQYGRPFFPHVGWVKATETTPSEYWFAPEQIEPHRQHLLELANLYKKGDKHVVRMFTGAFRAWKTNRVADGPVEALCHADDHVAVDLEGNRYGCHHTVDLKWRTGTIERDGITPNEQSVIKFTRRFVSTDACQSCHLRKWCRGHCHRSQTHDVDCKMQFVRDEMFRNILSLTETTAQQ